MSEDKFTESDAENDGLVKREAGQQLNSVLARESGELYTKFRDYCDKNGLDPSIVLGDMVLRAIKDEAYAQEVSTTVVDIEKLNKGDVRREDLELVTDIIEKFGANQDSGKDPIDKMLEERLSAVGQGPLGGIDENRKEGAKAKDEKIRKLEREIEELKRSRGGGSDTSDTRTRETTTTTTTTEEPDVDSLFDDSDDTGSSDDNVGSDVRDDAVENGETGEVGELFDGDGGDSDDNSNDDTTVETVDLGDDSEPTPEEQGDGSMSAAPEEPFSTESATEDTNDNE